MRFEYAFVHISIHVCIYSTVLLLITFIDCLCWLCTLVSCEFALQILEYNNLNLNLNLILSDTVNGIIVTDHCISEVIIDVYLLYIALG